MSTIPASQLVRVNPNVLNAGGSALVLNGLILTENTRVPIGEVLSFPNDGVSIANYFGASAPEVDVADVYFNGFNGSSRKPSSILFTQYPAVAVAAYLRGGASGLTLAAMQALSGSLNVVIDGYAHAISSIDLSAFNSFSAAAAAIGAAFTDPTEASFTASLGASFTASAGSPSTKLVVTAVTGLVSVGDTVIGTGIPANTTILSQDTGGTPGGAGTYVLSNANTASAASCTCSSNVLDVTVCATPSIAVGQTLAGSGVTGAPVITAQLGGADGGVGTYRISGAPLEVASEAMTAIATPPVVIYDSVSAAFVITSAITGEPSTAAFATGTLAVPLALTQATGAVLSQGADATTPAAFMTDLIQTTQNWASFMTMFDPDNGSGHAEKLAFAEWTNDQDNRFAYIVTDNDITATESSDATDSLGRVLAVGAVNGSCVIYDPNDQNLSAFICGSIASIDFDAINGRITFAFRGQDGLVAGVTDATSASNLIANSYNFYGAYATANQSFLLFQPGSVSGEFEWLDSYVNQIWLNNALQLALMELLQNINSVPYNQQGYELIKAACADPINAALSFGAIVAGVTLSNLQASEINTAAGAKVSDVITQQGWYLQVLDAAPITRQARQSPPINFWYADGGSVQQIVLNSVLVQ